MDRTPFRTKTQTSINLIGYRFLLTYQLQIYHMKYAPGPGGITQLQSLKAFHCGAKQPCTQGEGMWQSLVTIRQRRQR